MTLPCRYFVLISASLLDQNISDAGREDDGSGERVQDDGGDPAAKRAKRAGQRYND